ncbi:MAG: hypothetical protein AABW63_02805 [Nanoarchaeota archaeon]
MRVNKLSSKEKRIITVLDGETGNKMGLESLALVLGIQTPEDVTNFRQNEIGNLVRMGYVKAGTIYRGAVPTEEIYLGKPGEKAKNILQGNYGLVRKIRAWTSRVF